MLNADRSRTSVRLLCGKWLSPTEAASLVSDRLCAPLATHWAKKYSVSFSTPYYFLKMLLLIEDKRFAVHCGIDPIAICRAIIFNWQGRSIQGASTLTQQVYTVQMRANDGYVRRNLVYKLRQIVWACCWSLRRSKPSVFKQYLESVYWGRSYHGIDGAARGYFGTTRNGLSAAQSFFLAERIASPNRVSLQRIVNLLNRDAIQCELQSNGTSTAEIIAVYDGVFGCGGEMWQLLAK